MKDSKSTNMNVGIYLSSFIISPSFTSQIATVSTWSTKSFILPRPGANRIFLMKPLLVVMFFEVFVLTSHKLRFPSESARTIWSLFHAMHVMVAEMNRYSDHKMIFGLILFIKKPDYICWQETVSGKSSTKTALEFHSVHANINSFIPTYWGY